MFNKDVTLPNEFLFTTPLVSKKIAFFNLLSFSNQALS